MLTLPQTQHTQRLHTHTLTLTRTLTRTLAKQHRRFLLLIRLRHIQQSDRRFVSFFFCFALFCLTDRVCCCVMLFDVVCLGDAVGCGCRCNDKTTTLGHLTFTFTIEHTIANTFANTFTNTTRCGSDGCAVVSTRLFCCFCCTRSQHSITGTRAVTRTRARTVTGTRAVIRTDTRARTRRSTTSTCTQAQT